jgi:D-alanyl-D-alanine carboxypeptidase/D-alanyl-D-alanine-endopeptidase (penicillin-binding protein 4)
MLATTGPAGSETKLAAVRLPGSPRLVVRGQIAADAQPAVEAQAVENPTQFYVNALGAALSAHGITVGGRAVDVDDLALPPDETRATLLLEDQSPPLSDIIDVTLKWSRNGYAETLLRTLPPFGERGSEARGLEVLRDTLRTWGIAEDYYIVRDGSGLSRYDHVSPNALTWLLTYMYLDPTHADHFRASLPVAGVAGTLSHRMASTAAAGRVWAKSGSLSQVRGLSGYMLTKDDEPLVFSILVNGYRGSSAEVEAVMDRALARVARFTRARAAH